MGGITRTVTIGTAISGVIAAAIWQLNDLVTPMMVVWTLAYLGGRVLALLLSWAITNAWKYDRWTETEWAADVDVKRRIMRFARWSCAIAQLVLDTAILLLAWPAMVEWAPRVWTAAVLIASMSLATFAYWSPDLWRWLFRVVLPRVNRDIRDGRQSVDISPQAPPDYAPDDDDTFDPAPKPPR